MMFSILRDSEHWLVNWDIEWPGRSLNARTDSRNDADSHLQPFPRPSPVLGKDVVCMPDPTSVAQMRRALANRWRNGEEAEGR